jgi:hypothetical protein
VARLIHPEGGSLRAEAAEALLAIRFDRCDVEPRDRTSRISESAGNFF